MKDTIKILLLLLLLGFTIYFKTPIVNVITNYILYKDGVVIEKENQYTLNYPFHYVHETDDFYAKDKNQLVDIIYTSLNHGANSFYFFCAYDGCIDDIYEMKETNQFSDINNFVHPYNGYTQLQITTNSLNKVTIDVEKAYTQENIIAIENKLNEILPKIINQDMKVEEKIKAFHNYIIQNTVYDKEYINNNLDDIYHPSHRAIGPLFYGKSLCGGYTNIMAIFLNKLGIPNYRIASEKHIWNLVKIEGNWYHLDLTWDDPSPTNTDTYLTTFFLITTEQLEQLHTGHHTFDSTIYQEANQEELSVRK